MSHAFPIRCHTPFKHYLSFHKDYGCNCGCGNSIFGGGSRTTINYNINNGGFWGGFMNSFGGFCGGIFGGLFGGLMNNIFGGFGMGGFMGIGNGGFGGGWGGGFGSGWNLQSVRDRMNNNNDNNKTKCEDKDQETLHKFNERMDALLYKTGATKSPEEATKLYNDIKAKIDKPDDDSHKETNKKLYEDLLKSLNFWFDFETDDDGKAKSAKLKDGRDGNNGAGAAGGSNQAVGAGAAGGGNQAVSAGAAGGSNQAVGAGAAGGGNVTFPTGLTNEELANIEADIEEIGTDKLATSDKIGDLKLYQATDKVKRPVIRNSGNNITMSGNFNGTNFPLDMSITTASGETHNYRCIQVTAGGYAIYTTPTKDTNNNKYILTIVNGQLELTQGTKLSGLADLQCEQ